MKRNDFTTLAFLAWIIILTCVIAIYDGNLKEERRKVAYYVTIAATEKRLRRKLEEMRAYKIIEVDVTAYSPSPAQTDSNPFETSCGQIVKPQDLDQFLFVAASRDLLKRFNPDGLFDYGDKIYLPFTIIDTMNARWKNRIDLFLRNQKLAELFGILFNKRIIYLEEKADDR